jgi:hypothetical protein
MRLFLYFNKFNHLSDERRLTRREVERVCDLVFLDRLACLNHKAINKKHHFGLKSPMTFVF